MIPGDSSKSDETRERGTASTINYTCIQVSSARGGCRTSVGGILRFRVAIRCFVPERPIAIRHFRRQIQVGLFRIPRTQFLPGTFRRRRNAGRDKCANHMTRSLRANLRVNNVIAAVVVSVMDALFAILRATGTTASANLTFVVLTWVLQVKRCNLRRLRQGGLRAIVIRFVCAHRASVLCRPRVHRVLLSRYRPRANALSNQRVLRRQLRFLVRGWV